MPPLVYMFLDETYKKYDSSERWIFACVVSSQTYWDTIYRDAQKIGEMRKKCPLCAIPDFFDKPGSFAVLTYVDIPKELIPRGERDRTENIPKMARTANVWSLCMLATVTDALHRVLKTSKIDLEIEVYYDPQSLTREHRRAFKGVIQEVLPTFPSDRNIRFGKIEAIEKSRTDKLRAGTQLADLLCCLSPELIQKDGGPMIRVRNLTSYILSMLAHFQQGDSDNESKDNR